MREALSTARRFGRVIRYAAGTFLLETDPDRLRHVAAALPGWRHTVERMGGRLPERSPIFRHRLRGGSGKMD